MFKTIGIFAKAQDERVRDALHSLLAYLQPYRLDILLDSSSAAYLPESGLPVVEKAELGRRCDLAISVGGDGTLLQAARVLAPYGTRLLGINLGRLGFLADIYPSDVPQRLGPVLRGEFSEETRFLLHAQAYRDGRPLAGGDALNDVVLHKWNTAHMFDFETRIDGCFVSKQRADGLIVSTPTGSTAYGLSVGGPILHPALNVLLLIFICPHSLSNRPIVVSAESRFEVTLSTRQPDTAQMTCDGVVRQELLPGDRVIIEKARQITLVHPKGHDYYAILRAKLHWGRTP